MGILAEKYPDHLMYFFCASTFTGWSYNSISLALAFWWQKNTWLTAGRITHGPINKYWAMASPRYLSYTMVGTKTLFFCILPISIKRLVKNQWGRPAFFISHFKSPRQNRFFAIFPDACSKKVFKRYDMLPRKWTT